MRRETDFVLEKAAWPTLLLEGGGRICRANQAARRVFDLKDNSIDSTLSSVWDEKNSESAEKFLEAQREDATSLVTLRLPTGGNAQFIAHLARVGREGQDYFLVQLFKESGAGFPELAVAPPPRAPEPAKVVAPEVKPKDTFAALLNAAWPAVMTDKQGLIQNANDASVRAFGEKAVAKGNAVTGFCSKEDLVGMAGLIQNPSQSVNTLFKILDANGAGAPYRVEACLVDDGKWIIFQFFKAVEKPEPPKEPPREEEFLLQNAEWPVLLVDKNGRVLRANRASVRVFGAGIEKEAHVSSIWASDNHEPWGHILKSPAPAESVSLKFKVKTGLPEDFLAQFCVTSRDDEFVLQLIKAPPLPEAPNQVKPASAAPPAPPVPAAVAAPAAAPGSAVEVNLAHKQKLDCALQLARSVALDFNNALTSILGHSSLLLSKMEANHPWRSSMGEIEKSAAKAAEIANDLAAFSRQEKDGRGQVAGNVNQLLERTVEAFQGSVQQPITITKQLERKLFTANFDEGKLQQALVKIFENAVESINGNGKISVQTKNLELTEPTQDCTAKLNAGNYVCVEVSDTGAGIADDVMPRIFEPFFTTKGEKHRGLGLAWVYGIVTNHGGGVAVSSQLGIGTSVRLYLPATGKIVRDVAVAGDLRGNQTILIVDDEDLLLTMGRMVLSDFGYTVLTANSGQKALELFTKSKKKIDLVITDLVMPNMSGRELGEHILKAAPDTRIIWCSGYVRSSSELESERYLQKPFSAQDLLRKVKQVLTQ